MKKLTLLILIVIPVLSWSQYDVEDVENDSTEMKEPKINPFKLKDKIYVGSGINALFGSRTFFYISPMVGYDITEKFSGGVSTMFQYFRSGTAYKESSIGAGIFARLRPIEQLVLETSINRYSTTINGNSDLKLKATSWMLGAGYASSLGGRSYYQIMLQYDLLRSINVPEPSLFGFQNGGGIYYKFGLVFYLSN
jgi:hypothetical protein